ncbi:metallophosphoesterase family protein [Antricoccus suffuscus]|uniref:metallophosphoesterase family protein n=1 Tax=Antricoccus suffuscus TaxID=1629062 RepID=UPI0011B1E763|nr:metallophosphoesterase [Antricoccus suffuscus]
MLEVVVGFVMRWALRLALPLAGAAAMLHLFPYRAVAGGVHFSVQGTLLTRPGLSADTTIGNWSFPHVDGLPIGVHISPEAVDVVRLAGAATRNGPSYVQGLQADIQRQIPTIAVWLLGEMLIGVLVGLAVAVSVSLSVRYLRRQAHRTNELRIRSLQFAVATLVIALVAGYGAITYNRRWLDTSQVTGTLAALQLFPGKLQDYYNQQSKATDVVHAIAGIEQSLQQNIDAAASAETSYNIMFISDMHLAATYPLVQQYAANFAVKLIINTGDESEFGTAAEMTPTYLDQLKTLTAKVPMIWLAGNHDSPATVQIMRSIPGVTVVGTKSADGSGFGVGAQKLNAFGLTIAALPDPRVYGGSGAYGSDKPSVVTPLEQHAVNGAVKDVAHSSVFDIFATHEPVAAAQLDADLPGQIRQTNAGHLHAQNKDSEVQQKGHPITLVEGSTGAGGLDAINTGTAPPPVEFSIESVAVNCQFTKLVRFQINRSGSDTAEPTANATSQNVSAVTITLGSQKIQSGRECAVSQGIGVPTAIGTNN